MCQIMEESNKEYAKQQAYQIAMRIIKAGKVSFEDIAKFTDLTLEEVQELAKLVKESA